MITHLDLDSELYEQINLNDSELYEQINLKVSEQYETFFSALYTGH